MFDASPLRRKLYAIFLISSGDMKSPWRVRETRRVHFAEDHLLFLIELLDLDCVPDFRRLTHVAEAALIALHQPHEPSLGSHCPFPRSSLVQLIARRDITQGSVAGSTASCNYLHTTDQIPVHGMVSLGRAARWRRSSSRCRRRSRSCPSGCRRSPARGRRASGPCASSSARSAPRSPDPRSAWPCRRPSRPSDPASSRRSAAGRCRSRQPGRRRRPA